MTTTFTSVLFDEVHFPKYGKMQISQKLSCFRANHKQIRIQRPRLRRNTLILVEQAGAFSSA